ncbi:MAG: DUF1553 domain-containing protein [Pedosphaera sp.]|nr:DUF1553 domain-containing protein [Pedosphaera sp.]
MGELVIPSGELYVRRKSVQKRASYWWFIPLISWAIAAHAGGSTSGREVVFNRDIRPILSDNCFQCHGPDLKRRKGKLRLDNSEDARADREGMPALVPGQPDKSELFRRITHSDPGERMPPADSGRTLSVREIALLKDWIQQGGTYQSHWAFLPPSRPGMPSQSATGWARNPIDQFVLAELERRDLRPSPEAEKTLLLRRVTLDLIGLPPTIQEIEAFLGDTLPGAYDRLVDRLLNSERYGEHMAAPWLDAARYADTNGYNNDTPRYNWRWRDWVIAAFNQNLPFDQFITIQLAGDLIPQASLDQKIATGFNRNHNITSEGGIIDEEYRLEYVADRVQTVSTVFLGLSMGCARCHDHKFDPISQKDYYAFFAFFNQVPEEGYHHEHVGNVKPVIDAPTSEQALRRDQLAVELAPVASQIELREARARRETLLVRGKRVASAGTHPTPTPPIRDASALDRVSPLPLGTAHAAGPTSQDSLLTLLNIIPDYRAEAQETVLFKSRLAASDSAYAVLRTQWNRLSEEQAALRRTTPTAMVMQELDSPRDTFVLKRGQYDKPDGKVSAAVPGLFPQLSAEAPANRLGLAQWLVRPDHPLTARVAVNRLWTLLFGRGIVETLEDFGSQGAWPTHPDLLDWLATEMIQRRWDTKSMLRLIVTSATYRQSSSVTPALMALDPDNRFLARGPRFRLTAEMIRDNALALPGLIHHQLGGPSVRPYQPPGLWTEVAVADDSYSGGDYRQDSGSSLYRRGLYTWWKRTCPPPALSTFDAPDREFCQMRRSRSDTPLQALVLLNDPTFVEAARHLAERILLEGGTSVQSRAIFAFRLATARRPKPSELDILIRIFEQHRLHYANDVAAAHALLAVGESKSDTQWDARDLAAWTTVASMLLNLDEVITKG